MGPPLRRAPFFSNHAQWPRRLFLAVGVVLIRPCGLVLGVEADGRVDVAKLPLLLLLPAVATVR